MSRFLDDEPIFPAVTYGIDIWNAARHREFLRVCREHGFPWISGDLDVQERYLDMRLSGESHNMAEMLATRKFPGTRTDREWNMGHCNGSQFDGGEPLRLLGDHYRRVAESQGINVTGKVYKSGLAGYPGDPKAWVSTRGEARQVLEERGWSSVGLVNVAPRSVELSDDPVVDPRLIASEADVRTKSGEMLGCKDREELVEKLTNLRAWKPDREVGREDDL